MGQKLVAPLILNEGEFNQSDLNDLQSKQPIWATKDLYLGQLAELFEITHPELLQSPELERRKQQFISNKTGKQPELQGCWVYFPWNGILCHLVGPKDYYALRTNRNRNLITLKEQQKVHDFRVGITGLSLGAELALSLAYSGVNNFKLVDFDIIETANLNRLRSGVVDVGSAKVKVAAERIYAINPFAMLDLYTTGLNEKNLTDYIAKPFKLDAIFDEIDDFPMKIRLRVAARQARIPVLMLTSLGDSVVIDIERYDLEPDLPLFHGLLGNLPEKILSTPLGEKEKIQYAMQLPDPANIPTRALESLLEINKTLVGRPQLASTITIDSGLAAYMVKALALGWQLTSGRCKLSLDDLFNIKKDDSKRPEVLEQLSKVIKPS